jgi:hypothetical protein
MERIFIYNTPPTIQLLKNSLKMRRSKSQGVLNEAKSSHSFLRFFLHFTFNRVLTNNSCTSRFNKCIKLLRAYSLHVSIPH